MKFSITSNHGSAATIKELLLVVGEDSVARAVQALFVLLLGAVSANNAEKP